MAYNRYANWQRVNPGPSVVSITGDVQGAITVQPGQASTADISLSPAPGQPAGQYGSAASSPDLTVDIYGRTTNASSNVAQQSWGLINAVTFSYTGDATGGPTSFNGKSNVSTALTLATVNSNVGTFGDAYHVAQFTVNAKGLVTAAANVAIIPKAPSSTVASLPASPADGLIYLATDCTLTAITGLGLAPTGGGSNKVLVYSAGGGWLML